MTKCQAFVYDDIYLLGQKDIARKQTRTNAFLFS